MSRSRNGVNIGTGGFVKVDVEALLLHLLREPVLDFAHERRVAQLQVLPGDLLGARHDAEGELQRVHVPVALHVLEPGERDVGGVLRLLDLFASRGVVVR